MKNKFLLTAALLTIGITACKKDDDNNNNNNNGNNLSQTDKDFMNRATYSNLSEVETGNMAKQKGTTATITNYGDMMVQDHGKAHNELSDIAQDRRYSLPTETDQEHKDMAAMLMALNGRAFDSTYIHKMVEAHDKTIVIFQNEISNGQSADVKSYASNKLPALQHHRHMADSIANAMFP